MAALAGELTAFFLFDVAETIRLAPLAASLGPRAVLATVDDKAPGAVRLRYLQPPVIADGDLFGVPTLAHLGVRVKFYDYGVASLALWTPFEGSWDELAAAARRLAGDETLGPAAEDACRRILARVSGHCDGPRETFLAEDYLVCAVTRASPALSADQMLQQHGEAIAQLVRGEVRALSSQERDEVLRHRLSYFADDLVVAAWSAAFVYEPSTPAGVVLEVLEFANSQLLEFRYHDERLEAALTRIYADLQHSRWQDRLIGRRHLRATRELHALFVDVNELTDRTENALKLVGDPYAARLFGLAAARLGLDHWKQNVRDKLQTLDAIYRFSVDQTRISQGNLLELVIVAILIIELGLTLWGLVD